jgi:deoxyribonuclease V
MDVPALGLAKSRLIGEAAEPGPEKGAWTWLADGGENIGQIVAHPRRRRPALRQSRPSAGL